MHPAGEDPQSLLEEAGQWTAPWGDSEDGAPCEKCEQAGVTEYCCWSCLLTGAAPECPVCAGRVRWSDRCPVCRGSGTVDAHRRRGVSVYPRLEGLYHYMLASEADVDDCVILELEGQRAPEVDFDADQGALLLTPRAICACAPVDRNLLERVREGSPELPRSRR
jgi:hypothetical protein